MSKILRIEIFSFSGKLLEILEVFDMDESIAKDIIAKTLGLKSVYTVEDAMKLLGRSRQAIYELIYEGILIPIENSNRNKPRKYTFTFLSLISAYIKLSGANHEEKTT